ncbi:MAG: helix-turn-helix domain-containing protein [Halothiobacillaceae bacterium]|nr:helix-turn-helix domain-containing protein [Halothiobacillaceae bacterium]
MYHYIECGLDNVWLDNGFEEEESDYGAVVSIHDMDGLHRVIGMHIIRSRPLLNGAELRFLRKEMDLSQSNLAQLLGVVDSSVRHWESGRGKISEPADRLVRILYAEYTQADTEIRSLIERIAHLNREAYENGMHFGETGSGWQPRTA